MKASQATLDGGKSVVCVASFLLCACLTAAGLAKDDEPWNVVEVGTRGDLSVRLKVRPRASLSDTNWMMIEFENRGGSAIELLNTRYRIDSTRCDLKTGRPQVTGGLASGSEFSLFPQAWKTVPVAPRVVKPGFYRVTDHPSMVTTSLLGLAPQDGWLVKAKLFMRVDIKGDGLLADSQDAHEFQFEWLYPDEAGFLRARAKLADLLKKPEDKVQHAYLLNCLLSIPEVSHVIGGPELLASLKNRDGSFTGRNYVLEYLGQHHARERIVVEHFRQRLEAGDLLATEDLRRATQIWDPSYLEPLLKIFARDHRSWDDVLFTLEHHGTPQKTDPKLASRLSAEMLKHPLIGALPPGTQRSKESLGRNLTILARSRDRALISKFAPYLDDRTKVLDPRLLASLRLGSLPPLRVCDAALEAIMMVLDDDVGKVYRKHIKLEFKDVDVLENEFNSVRDQMIADLKTRLAKDEHGEKQ